MREVEVDDERRRPAVVPHQVGHQAVDDERIEAGELLDGYLFCYYSSEQSMRAFFWTRPAADP
jgi:hypothetical protein